MRGADIDPQHLHRIYEYIYIYAFCERRLPLIVIMAINEEICSMYSAPPTHRRLYNFENYTF